MNRIKLQLGTASVVYNGELFFSGVGINGLFKSDLKTGNTQLIKEFSKENIGYQIHGRAFLHKQEVWLVPLDGEYISCVNLDTSEIEYFDMPFGDDRDTIESIFGINRFASARWDDDRFFVVSTFSKSVVLVDMKRKEIIEIPSVLECNETAAYCTVGMGHLWIALAEGESLISINLENCEIARIKQKINLYDYSNIVAYKNKIWFTPRKASRILFYDFTKGIFGHVELGDSYSEKYTYKTIAIKDSYLCIMPWFSDRYLILNADKSNSINTIDISDRNICYMIDIESDTTDFYASTGGCGKLIRMNEKNDIAFSVDITIDSDSFVQLLKRNYGEKNVYNYWKRSEKLIKEEELGLASFLKII